MTPLIFAVPGNEAMVEKLASTLDAEHGATTMRHFPDGESYVRVEPVMEGRRVTIVYMLDRPDGKLIPLLLLAAATRKNGVTNVGLVTPCLAYMRQGSCSQPGETVDTRHFAAWLSCGFDWLTIVSPHLHRITKLLQVYVIPARHAHAAPIVAAWLRTHVTRLTLVGLDEESSQWVADATSRTDAPMVVLHKVRKSDRNVEVLVPDMERRRDHTPVLVDDIVSAGHTMTETIGHLRRAGLAAPVCITIHAMFSSNTVQDLRSTGTRLVVNCNTVIHLTGEISVAPDLASVVRELMQDPGGTT